MQKIIRDILITLNIVAIFGLYGLNKIQDVPQDGQTPVKVADIPQYTVQSEYGTVLMNVSAYCPCEKCCGVFADGITASGVPAVGYFVAAPPNYAFGTLMVIPGYAGRPVPVLDRGGAIKGNKLDIFFPTHQEALIWGRQYLKVELKGESE